MSIDPPHRVKAEILQTKSLYIVSSCKELKPADEVDEEESSELYRSVVPRLIYRKKRESWCAFHEGRSRNILSLTLSDLLHQKRIRMATSGRTSTWKR